MATTSTFNQISPRIANYLSLLETYSKSRSLTNIKQLHAHLLSSASLPSFPTKPFILRSNLASSYALCGHLRYARTLFDEVPQPTLFLYNAIMFMYSRKGFPTDVLRHFVDMVSLGRVYPDPYTYTSVIKACGDLMWVKMGEVVHGKVVVGGCGLNVFVLNALLAMYMNWGDVKKARRVFNVMRVRDGVSWASMIAGCVRNGRANEALLIFDEMVSLNVEINRSSVVSVLSACGNLEDLGFGRRVHAVVEVQGLQNEVSLSNALINMYGKCGSVEDAQKVFHLMEEKDVVTWTTLMNGYVLNDCADRALRLSQVILQEGVVPNSVTIVMLLKACGDLCALKQGKCLHSWITKREILSDTIIETAMIEMYTKCDSIGLGFRVFTLSSHKTGALWNSMISGYIHVGLAMEAICCFKQMLHEAVEPDVITVSGVLVALAELADERQAGNIHSYLMSSGFLSHLEAVRGLVDLYSKCGNLEYSHMVIKEIPQECRDISLWSALIAGYGAHGHGEVAVSLYKQMVQSGIRPDMVTVSCVLDTCSHAGLVDEGLDLFKLTIKNCQTYPCMYHYTCMVDLLGRAGRLQEAYDLIKTMPFKPNHVTWGALLGACALHENAELGEIAAKWLIELEPENAGNYVLLANIYSASGRWKDAENTRAKISDIKSGKTPGNSSIEAIVL